MKINLSIPDELAEKYIKNHGLPAAYQRMRVAIEAFQDVVPTDRHVFLAGDDRRAVEAVFQTTIDDGKKLARLVKQMSQFAIGGVEVNFSVDELARIDAQAGFHGRTRDVFVREMVTEIKDYMLEKF